MATRPEDMFKDDSLGEAKASKEFRLRKEGNVIKDGRDFKTWYHIDDAQRLIWKYFNDLKDLSVVGSSQLTKDLMLAPYVSFDDIRLDTINFFTVLINYFNQKENQNKRYLPFMVKPEIGGAHYIAGILRRTPENQLDIIIFNPVGLTQHDRIGTELAKLNKEQLKIANIFSSPHPIQSTEKDDGPLVSCGPIGVEFLRLAMSNLDWVARLDKSFSLPEEFLAPLQQNYQETVNQYRSKHDQLLKQVSEQDLDQLDEDYKYIVSAMLDGLTELIKQESRHVATESSEEDSSSGERNDLFDDEFYFDSSDKSGLISDEEEDITTPEGSEDDSEIELLNENVDTKKIDSPQSSPKSSPQIGHKDYSAAPEILITSPIVEKREDKQPQTLNFTINLEVNRSDKDASSLAGVKSVKEEISRLRTASKRFFSIRCEKKAKLIEAALSEAMQQNQDVRDNEGVRKALGYHRIFSFFGLKKAAALQHIEESLNNLKNP